MLEFIKVSVGMLGEMFYEGREGMNCPPSEPVHLDKCDPARQNPPVVPCVPMECVIPCEPTYHTCIIYCFPTWDPI